jgi:hypothetical protein
MRRAIGLEFNEGREAMPLCTFPAILTAGYVVFAGFGFPEAGFSRIFNN